MDDRKKKGSNKIKMINFSKKTFLIIFLIIFLFPFFDIAAQTCLSCQPNTPYKLADESATAQKETLASLTNSDSTGVTLVWSADTYTPPGYQGRKLPIKGSIVEVAAILDSSNLNPRELEYIWYLNDKQKSNQSGWGKETFKFEMGNDFNNSKYNIVYVEIKDINGALIASSESLSIKIFYSETVIKTDALFLPANNIYNYSPEYRIPANQSIQFIAMPYFFNTQSYDELSFDWYLDGERTIHIDDDYSDVFVLNIGEIGQNTVKDLSVWVENKNDAFQRAKTTVQLIFQQ